MSNRDFITGTFSWTPPEGTSQQTTNKIILTVSGSTLVIEESTRNLLTDPVTPTGSIRGTTITSGASKTPVISIISGKLSEGTTSRRTFTRPSPSPSPVSITATASLPITTSGSLVIATTLITSSIQTSTSTSTFVFNTSVSGPSIPLETVPGPTSTKAPVKGFSNITITGMVAGGVVFLVLLIGLIFFLCRTRKARLRNKGSSIKSRVISNPVRPPLERSDSVRTFPNSPRSRFSQDSQDILLSRTNSHPKVGNSGHSPSVWTKVTPQVQTLPSSPGFSPAQAYIPMSEVFSTLPIQTALEPNTFTRSERSRRVASSIYPTYGDEYGDDVSTKSENPYRYTGNPNPPPQVSYKDIGNPYNNQNTSKPTNEPRNLMVPASARRRRADVVSSWMSNGNYQLERPVNNDRSSYTSNFGFDSRDGAGNSNTDVPFSVPSPLDSVIETDGRSGLEKYGFMYDSVLALYGDKAPVRLGEETTLAERRGQSGREKDGRTTTRNDLVWDNQRRGLFEGR